MNRREVMFGLVAVAVATCPHAQIDERRRNQGGTGGQPVGIFKVVSVDTYASTLTLQAADGSTSVVKVPGGVYDLTKLAVGESVQVNFYVPDAMNPGLRASAIWPVK
jgi:hypothetical protein